jgi:NitT/TauT family transport system substrate-binding protein
MKISPPLKTGVVLAAGLVTLGLLRYHPWTRKPGEGAGTGSGTFHVLKVGFLPVTCHLTCPVTAFATRHSKNMRFTSELYHDWPTITEAFEAGRLQATFMLAPMAMQMVAKGVGCKIVYLGHRDGSTMVVGIHSAAKSLLDLKGQTIAVPSFDSNQYLVLLHAMRHLGMPENSIHFVQLAPPDMPTALATHSIAGYFVGEPFAGKAEMMGIGKVLYYSNQLWPHFISCVMVASDGLIRNHPAEVRALVKGIADSGAWAETHRVQAAEVAAPYFRQDPKLLKYVLTSPVWRVKYSDLTPTNQDMLSIEDDAVKAGLLKQVMPVASFLDTSFIPKKIVPDNIDVPAADHPQVR